jgi:hypothetical protein
MTHTVGEHAPGRRGCLLGLEQRLGLLGRRGVPLLARILGRDRRQAEPEGQEGTPKAEAPRCYRVTPTYSNVPCGAHERRVLDSFKTDAKAPAQLVAPNHGRYWV